MSQPTYSYGAATHNDAASAITKADSTIRQELDDCNRIAMQNLDSWISTMSRAQYDQHKATWDKAFTKMQQILAGAAPALMNAKENYDAHDRSVKAMFA